MLEAVLERMSLAGRTEAELTDESCGREDGVCALANILTRPVWRSMVIEM